MIKNGSEVKRKERGFFSLIGVSFRVGFRWHRGPDTGWHHYIYFPPKKQIFIQVFGGY